MIKHKQNKKIDKRNQQDISKSEIWTEKKTPILFFFFLVKRKVDYKSRNNFIFSFYCLTLKRIIELLLLLFWYVSLGIQYAAWKTIDNQLLKVNNNNNTATVINLNSILTMHFCFWLKIIEIITNWKKKKIYRNFDIPAMKV